MKVRMFRMPFKTKHFNKEQRVWLRYMSGDSAAEVYGKFRGCGRYVISWVKWQTPPDIKIIDVTEEFYNRIFGKEEL